MKKNFKTVPPKATKKPSKSPLKNPKKSPQKHPKINEIITTCKSAPTPYQVRIKSDSTPTELRPQSDLIRCWYVDGRWMIPRRYLLRQEKADTKAMFHTISRLPWQNANSIQNNTTISFHDIYQILQHIMQWIPQQYLSNYKKMCIFAYLKPTSCKSEEIIMFHRIRLLWWTLTILTN